MARLTLQISRGNNKISKPAIIISMVYFMSGITWILTSDTIAAYLAQDISSMVAYQSLKGFVFIAITAVLLFFLVNKQVRRRDSLIGLLKSENNLLSEVLDHQKDTVVLMIDETGKILQAFGTLDIWEGVETKKLAGRNIDSWRGNNEDRSILSRFIKTIMLEGSYAIDSKIGKSHYSIKGNLIVSKSLDRVALVIIQNRDREHFLLEELQKCSEDSRHLSSKLLTTESALTYQQQKLREVLNSLEEGIIIWQPSENGTLLKVEDFGISAPGILKILPGYGKAIDSALLEAINDIGAGELVVNDYFKEGQKVIVGLDSPRGKSTHQVAISARRVYINGEPRIIMQCKESEVFSTGNALAPSFKAFMEGLSAGAVLIDKNKRCLFVNNAMKRLPGFEYAPGVAASFNDIKASKDLMPLLEHALQGGIPASTRYHLGGYVGKPVVSSFYPVTDKNNQVEHVFCITSMVDVRHEAKSELHLQQKSFLNNTNPLKPILLSCLSHEVLTPMNGIIGFLELLENEPLTTNQAFYIKHVRQGSENLLVTIDSLLRIAAIDNGQVKIEKSWFETDNLFDEIIAFAKQKTLLPGKQGIEICSNFTPGRVPDKIFSDRNKVAEIMQHMISNMLKHKNKGVIEMGVTKVAESNIAFWMSDKEIKTTAGGCNETDSQARPISGPGHQLQGDPSLWILIAKGLANMIGGELDIECGDNQDSRFTLTIPLKPMPLYNGSNSPAGQHEKIVKILIVQYGFQALKKGVQYIGNQKVELFNVNNGADAIELVHNHKDMDLLLCDTRLTDMEGIELLNVVRRMCPFIHAVAQAPFFVAEEKQRCMAHGFNDYLVRPFDLEPFISGTGWR